MSRTPELYRTPRKPGYLGGYNWRATALGLLLLVLVNFAATQYIAAQFQYQPALGRPLLQTEHGGHLSAVRLGRLGLAQLDLARPADPEAAVHRRDDRLRRQLRLRRHLLRADEPALPAS